MSEYNRLREIQNERIKARAAKDASAYLAILNRANAEGKVVGEENIYINEEVNALTTKAERALGGLDIEDKFFYLTTLAEFAKQLKNLE